MQFFKYRKSLLFLIFFVSVFYKNGSAQSAGDYKSVASGNWSALTTWQRYSGAAWVVPTIAQGVPTSASGAVTLQTTFIVTVDVSTTIDQLTIAGTLTIPAGITLTVNNGALTDVQIVAGGSLINNGTITPSSIVAGSAAANTAAFLMTNAGTITNNGTIYFNTTTSNTFTSSAGTITNSSTGIITVVASSSTSTAISISAGTLVNSGTITTGGYCSFGSTCTYQHSFPSTGAATGTIPTATWVAGSTCEILGCGNSGGGPGGLGQTFKNFIWNYATQPGTVDLAGALTTINSNFTVTTTNNRNLILKTGITTSTTNVGGAFTLTSGNVILDSTSTGAAVYNFTAGSFSLVSGQLTVAKVSGTSTGTAYFTVSNASTLSGGTLNICASNVASGGNGDFKATSGTITINGATVNVASGTLSSSGCLGSINANAGLVVSAGTLNLCSSPVACSGNSGFVYVSGGNFSHTGGTISKTGVNTGTISISGSTPQTIESIGFASGNSIAFNIAQNAGTGTCSIAAGFTFVQNPGTVFTVNQNLGIADFTIAGTFISNIETWSFLSGITSVTGVFINNSTASISANSNAITLNFAATGIFRVAGNGGEVPTATWSASSTIQVQGITTATTLGNGGQSFGKIDWNSTGQTASTDFGASGFDIQTSYTLTSTGSGTLRFPDEDFTIGTVYSNTNRLILTGSSKLQVTNGVNLYSSARNITINGNVDMSGTSTLLVGSPNTSGVAVSAVDQSKDINLLLKGNFVFSGGSPVLIPFDHVSFPTGDESYHLILNFCGGIAQTVTIPVVASNIITVGTESTSNNPYQITVSGASTILTPSVSLKAKSFLIDVGATLTLTASTNLTVYPLLTIAGVTDQGSVVVNGSTIASYGTLDMNTAIIQDATGTGSSTLGTFTLNNYAKLKTQNTLGISATGATGSVQVGGTRNYNAKGYYHYNNLAAAQITGLGLPTILTYILDIQSLATTAGGVTLSQATSITTASGKLTLTAGRLITSAVNLITIGSGASVSTVGASNKFVDGPMKKIGNTAFTFPLGDVTGATIKWAPLSISAPTLATDAFTAEFVNANPHSAPGGSVYGVGITDVSYREYWTLTQVSGSSTPNVTLFWKNGSLTNALGSGIFSILPADLQIAEWYDNSGFKWNNKGGTINVASTTSVGDITTSIAPTFVTGTAMPFTFMAPTTVNPLPIELTSFSGSTSLNGNLLTWITASETNNDHFELERSKDAENFEKITTIEGHGNSTTTINYNYLDENIGSSLNYYRLKQVDFNGNFTYSNTIALENTILADSYINPYPNPTADGIINLNINGNITSLVVYNMLGEIIYNSDNITDKNITVKVIAKGVYVVKAYTSNNELITTKFTKE